MAQQEYEQSKAIDAPPEEASRGSRTSATSRSTCPRASTPPWKALRPRASVPGRRIRTTLEYLGEGGGMFDAVGYLAVDERECRMERGAEEGRDYSGWLTVANHGEGGSEVVVHLSFGERSAGPDIDERSPEGSDPLAEGVSATLESIRGR